MITGGPLTRVLKIKFSNATATAFTLEKDDEQFLITAKHLFNKNTSGSFVNLEITRDNQQFNLTCQVFFHDNAEIDIAVLKLINNTNITNRMIVNFNDSSIILGHDAYIVGFPFGLVNSDIEGNFNYPTPFVKRGCISATTKENGADVIYADSVNNIGFSGGPLVTYNPMNYKEQYIIGVISGYRVHISDVYDKDNKKTGSYVRENSGLTKAYSIKHVFEIIQKIKPNL